MASSEGARDAELAAFVPTFALVLWGSAHEVVNRQTDAYLGPGFGPVRSVVVCVSLVGFALGLWLGRRASLRAPRRARLLIVLTSVLSLACSASGPLWFAAFGAPALLAPVAYGLPPLVALLAGATTAALFHGLGLAYRELGAIRLLLSPLPLLGALTTILLGAIAFSFAGLWRAAAVFAALLAVFAALVRRFGPTLSDPTPVSRRAAVLAVTAAVASLAAAQAFVPASAIASYPAEVVWTEDDGALVVTSAQNTFQLFESQQARLTSSDAYRVAELAVHPALATRTPAQRVLLLGPAGGFLEHEILRHSSVSSLLSLSERALTGFAGSLWPQSSHGRLHDGRLRFVTAEPLPWLEQSSEKFDAIIVSLPAPATYLEGKYHTAYAYRLFERHLSATGVLVVQATSAATLPHTFATLRQTLQTTGLDCTAYEAPIPLLGALSFLVGSRAPFLPDPARLPQHLRLLDAAALARSLAIAPPLLSASPSTLDHQRAVEAFQRDQTALGN